MYIAVWNKHYISSGGGKWYRRSISANSLIWVSMNIRGRKWEFILIMSQTTRVMLQ